MDAEFRDCVTNPLSLDEARQTMRVIAQFHAHSFGAEKVNAPAMDSFNSMGGCVTFYAAFCPRYFDNIFRYYDLYFI